MIPGSSGGVSDQLCSDKATREMGFDEGKFQIVQNSKSLSSSAWGLVRVYGYYLLFSHKSYFPCHANIHYWNSACTLPYFTPSTINSKTKFALWIFMCNSKSKFENSWPLLVVKVVNRLWGTADRSVLSLQTLMRFLL
jgi:hypothetical protein